MRNVEFMVVKLLPVAMIQTPSGYMYITVIMYRLYTDQYEESRALEDLIKSGTTLMKEFIGLLKSIHALHEVQSEFTKPAVVMDTQYVCLVLASVPGRFFSKDTEGEKNGLVSLVLVLTYSLESGESPLSFFDHVTFLSMLRLR